MNFPYVCGVRYWDEVNHGERTTFHLLYGNKFADIANTLESYYGDTLFSIEIHCVAEEGTLFEINEETANMLIDGEGAIK